MTVSELIERASQLGIRLWVEGDRLRYDAPEGTGRTLKWTFVVNGPGAGAMADAIDAVITEQFGRLADHLSALSRPA